MPSTDASALLVEASHILFSSLDYEDTLARVADAVVPRFADWCTVTIVNPETGKNESLLVKHLDPEKRKLAEEWRARLDSDPNRKSVQQEVITTGKSVLTPLITPEMVASYPISDEIKTLITQLEIHSFLCVPVKARGQTLGAISFVWAESKKRYAESDVAVFEEVASNAAVAIDNARLYGSAQRELASRTRAEQEVRRLNRELSQHIKELASRARQQAAIARLGQIALTGAPIQELLDATATEVSATLEVEYVKILERIPSSDRLLLRAGSGWRAGLVGSATLNGGGHSQAGYTLTADKPVITADLRKEKRFVGGEILREHGAISGMSVIVEGDGEPWGVLGAHTKKKRHFSEDDISFLQSAANVLALSLERLRVEENMRYQAFHDPVTGIPNRALLEDRLEMEIVRAKRTGTQVGVLFLDLDNFKYINDSLGHAVGDQILRGVASRLEGCISEGDTIARFGGDEFLMVIPQMGSLENLESTAECILRSFDLPFFENDHELRITTSIGVSIYPQDGDTAEAILKNADTALYRAKELGRNGYRLYTQTMNLRSSERLALETELRKAMDRQQFELWYQPIIEISTDRIIGAEALLRWCHPTLGVIYPNDFWPLAEETGLSIPLLDWSLRTAANQIVAWDKEDLPQVTINLNLSARQLEEKSLIPRCKRILDETGINPQRIEIEITESMAMQNIDQAVEALQALRDLGFEAAVDDFGTGHSSLSYLKRLPVKKLKIDRSFVRDCVNNPQDAAIIRAIISLAQTLSLEVIAEGVEHKDQLSLLMSLGCNEAQGYLFNPALPAASFTELLQ